MSDDPAAIVWGRFASWIELSTGGPMRNIPARIFYLCALVAAVVVALVILRTFEASTVATASDVVVTSPQTRPPEQSTTTTTTDLTPAYEFAADWQRAEVAAYLQAWHDSDVIAYVTAVKAAQDESARHVAAARQNATRATQVPVRTSTAVAKPQGGGGSGGCAIPAYICQRESGGSYTAVNPSSGAGGKYQFLPSTWRALGGTGLPQNASPAVQDAMAAKLWAGGAGCAHWSAC